PANKQWTRICQVAGNGSGRDHGRRHDVRAGPRSLPPPEIAICCRGTAFAGWDEIAIDPDTHRTSGFGPFEAGIPKDAIETLLLRLLLARRRTRRDFARHLGFSSRKYRGSNPQ